MNTRNLVAAALLGVASAGSMPAVADDDDMAKMQAIAKGRGFLTPEQAIERALAVKPGTVVETDLDRRFNGDYEYEVEIVDAEGTEWELKLDAKTGEVRKTKREWD